MFNLFDAYELRARLFPVLLVFLPAWITATVLGEWTGGPVLASIIGGTMVLPLVYCGSMLVRHLGRSIETKLWESWAGPPTTRFLRWRDSTLTQSQKLRLHTACREQFGIELASLGAEESDPQSADELIYRAVREIRAVLRQKDKDGLWNKHNAEYGFCRNLLGSRRWWSAIALVGLATCGGLFGMSLNGALIAGMVLNGVTLVAAIYLGWHRLPRIAAATADRYGESTLSSFLALNPVKREAQIDGNPHI
jgi:hypothetical protein